MIATDDVSTVVWISGDGSFYYSTFALQNPHRFVVDQLRIEMARGLMDTKARPLGRAPDFLAHPHVASAQ